MTPPCGENGYLRYDLRLPDGRRVGYAHMLSADVHGGPVAIGLLGADLGTLTTDTLPAGARGEWAPLEEEGGVAAYISVMAPPPCRGAQVEIGYGALID